MAIAGMAAGDGTAWLLIRHPGIARVEIADALRKRWPSAVVCDAGTMEPCWTLAVEDALELARARRGVEPLRVVVLGQRTEDTHSDRRATVPLRAVEPMPVVV